MTPTVMQWLTTIVAMLLIAGLVALALVHLGINGALLTTGIAAIAGLGGYTVGATRKKSEPKPPDTPTGGGT